MIISCIALLWVIQENIGQKLKYQLKKNERKLKKADLVCQKVHSYYIPYDMYDVHVLCCEELVNQWTISSRVISLIIAIEICITKVNLKDALFMDWNAIQLYNKKSLISSAE